MQVSVTEAKGQLTEIVRRAEAGDEVVLTRHGQATVELVPVRRRPDADARRAVIARMRAAAAGKRTAGASVARSQDFLYGGDGRIIVTDAKGERRRASQWVGKGGRSRTLRGARVRGRKGVEVGTVVCVQDHKMKQPWCLVASEGKIGTRTLIRYYAKRWGIETSFRDLKDMRFGMGTSAMRVSSPQRRDRMLLLSALAIGLSTLLGAAGESLGHDRWLRANTVKYRTHSLFRQGLMLYEHIPNWPEHRLRPLMKRFAQLLMEQRVYREVFAVI